MSGVDREDEKIELNIKLHFHSLRVFCSHRDGYVLVEFIHKLVSTALIEELNR